MSPWKIERNIRRAARSPPHLCGRFFILFFGLTKINPEQVRGDGRLWIRSCCSYPLRRYFQAGFLPVVALFLHHWFFLRARSGPSRLAEREKSALLDPYYLHGALPNFCLFAPAHPTQNLWLLRTGEYVAVRRQLETQLSALIIR